MVKDNYKHWEQSGNQYRIKVGNGWYRLLIRKRCQSAAPTQYPTKAPTKAPTQYPTPAPTPMPMCNDNSQTLAIYNGYEYRTLFNAPKVGTSTYNKQEQSWMTMPVGYEVAPSTTAIAQAVV